MSSQVFAYIGDNVAPLLPPSMPIWEIKEESKGEAEKLTLPYITSIF